MTFLVFCPTHVQRTATNCNGRDWTRATPLALPTNVAPGRGMNLAPVGVEHAHGDSLRRPIGFDDRATASARCCQRRRSIRERRCPHRRGIGSGIAWASEFESRGVLIASKLTQLSGRSRPRSRFRQLQGNADAADNSFAKCGPDPRMQALRPSDSQEGELV